MQVEQVFSGSALDAVGKDGAVPLPPFIRRVIESGGGTARVVVGAHESDPCLTVYEPGYAPALRAEIERRRLRDEAAGAPALDHHIRTRRMFGFVEDAWIDREGRLILPAMMRRKGRIDDLALFVGAGGSFEIWNPHLARASGDDGLRELAEYRLGEAGQRISMKEE